MAADANAGHQGNATPAVMNNPDNKCPADRPGYNPASFSNQPGAAARANGYPRATR